MMTPKDRTAAAVVRATRRALRIGGHVVPVANAHPDLAAAAARLLLDERQHPEGAVPVAGVSAVTLATTPEGLPFFCATYHDGADGLRHFELRSTARGADVGEVARALGGDGTARVATFAKPLAWEGE